jgi:hypothetical protein
MEYTIHTLEIEITRLRKALREARSISLTAVDVNDGYPADIQGMEWGIRELERSIEIIIEWEEANPSEADHFRNRGYSHV